MKKRTKGKVAGEIRRILIGDRVVILARDRHFAEVGKILGFASKLGREFAQVAMESHGNLVLWFGPEDLQPVDVAMAAAEAAIREGLKGLSEEELLAAVEATTKKFAKKGKP